MRVPAPACRVRRTAWRAGAPRTGERAIPEETAVALTYNRVTHAVMMATLQRVQEIGTMRAIGAQRAFVLKLVLIETLLLGLSFGAIGTLLGALLVAWLGHVPPSMQAGAARQAINISHNRPRRAGSSLLERPSCANQDTARIWQSRTTLNPISGEPFGVRRGPIRDAVASAHRRPTARLHGRR